MNRNELLTAKLKWTQQAENRKFFVTNHAGKNYQLRLNNFPEEPLYTFIGDEEFDLEDKPESWTIEYIKD